MSYFPPDTSWKNLYQMGFNPALNVGIFDPGSKLSGAPALGSDGALTLPMAGGWVAANQTAGNVDPGTDGIFGAVPIYCDGVPATGDVEVGLSARCRPSGVAPVAADDIAFFMGIINDATLFGGSVRGVLTVGDFTTTVGPRTRGIGITAGVSSALNANNAATPATNMVGWETQMSKAGKGGGAAASFTYGLRNTAITNILELIAGTGANATIGVGSPGIGQMYFVFGGWRTRLANAAAKSIPMIFEISRVRITRY